MHKGEAEKIKKVKSLVNEIWSEYIFMSESDPITQKPVNIRMITRVLNNHLPCLKHLWAALFEKIIVGYIFNFLPILLMDNLIHVGHT